MKKNQSFLSENFRFLEVKFSIYLNKHVFVMIRSTWKILHFLGMFGYFLMSIPSQLTFYLNAQHTAKNRSGWQKTGFGISCKLSQPAFVWNVTVCFLGQIKQNIINLSSAESAHRVVKVCKSILIICIIGQTGILSGQQRSDFDLSRLLVGLFFSYIVNKAFLCKRIKFLLCGKQYRTWSGSFFRSILI